MFSDPSNNIAQLALQSGSHVAELGAGTGEIAFAAALAVGSAGRVYAVDVQKDLLDRLKNHARQKRLHNIEVIWGEAERMNEPPLKAHTVDAAICSNLLFQIEDKPGLVEEVKRILRPNGKLLVIDWFESFRGMGPQPAQVVGEIAAHSLFEQSGFKFVKAINVGAHHYGLIFKKVSSK